MYNMISKLKLLNMYKVCQNCKNQFKTYRSKRKFCSHICFLKSPINTSSKVGENNVSKRLLVRLKMSESAMGKHQNENNPKWKGDNVGYDALHAWVKRHYGKPPKCEHCGTTKKRICWANKTKQYLRERTDWLRLCYSCHKKYDLKLNIPCRLSYK